MHPAIVNVDENGRARDQSDGWKAGMVISALEACEIFASADSNTVIGELKAGEHRDVAGALIQVGEYGMLPIRPEGVVQVDWLERVPEASPSSVLDRMHLESQLQLEKSNLARHSRVADVLGRKARFSCSALRGAREAVERASRAADAAQRASEKHLAWRFGLVETTFGTRTRHENDCSLKSWAESMLTDRDAFVNARPPAGGDEEHVWTLALQEIEDTLVRKRVHSILSDVSARIARSEAYEVELQRTAVARIEANDRLSKLEDTEPAAAKAASLLEACRERIKLLECQLAQCPACVVPLDVHGVQAPSLDADMLAVRIARNRALAVERKAAKKRTVSEMLSSSGTQ